LKKADMGILKCRYGRVIAGLLAVALLSTGCDRAEGTVIIEDGDDSICFGLVEGAAFYPYYEGGVDPVYYADGNHDILVVLYDEFDRIVSDDVTGPSGSYAFDGLPPGYYYVAAHAETYVETQDLFDIYVAETPLFRVGECGWVDEVNLFLEYSHTEF
jgi:hypothetical protein